MLACTWMKLISITASTMKALCRTIGSVKCCVLKVFLCGRTIDSVVYSVYWQLAGTISIQSHN